MPNIFYCSKVLSINDEQSVISYIAKGNSKKDVAKKFKVSYDTINNIFKFHKKNNTDIYKKYFGDSTVNSSTVNITYLGNDRSKNVKTKPKPKAVKKEVKKNWVWAATQSSLSITDGVTNYIATPNINKNYAKIIELLIAEKFDEAILLTDPKVRIKYYSRGSITIINDELFYKGLKIQNSVVDRIIDFTSVNKNFEGIILFLERLLENPSKNSVDTLWNFMENNCIEITNQGYILGYKKVSTKNGKLFDSYTKTIPQEIGSVVEMPRYLVKTDPSDGCSIGLHVGAKSYVSSFTGDTILVVLVNPADVVSVPNDCDFGKMRVCSYYIAGSIDSIYDTLDESQKQYKKPHNIITTGPYGIK